MIATSRDYRLKAVDCEEHAKAASDPAVIQEWQALAMRWRSMALQASNEMLVGPLRDGLILLRHKPLRPYVSCAWSAAAWAAWQASDDSGDEPSAHGRD